MKYFVFLFFFGLSASVYSANSVIEEPLLILNNVEDVKNKTLINKYNKQDVIEKAVAFKCYYTVEWLYKDSPFIDKIEALA